MLINLNEAEVKFVIHAVQETAAKILSKMEAKPAVTAVPVAGAVRLTKAGRPAKKPGRKPGKKPALKPVQPVEQAA